MTGRRNLDEAIAARRRNEMVARLRSLAQRPQGNGTPARGADPPAGGPPPAAGEEACDLCGAGIPPDHRHMLNVVERQIVCACESCWAIRSGDAEFRPVGSRTLWLPDLEMPDDVWASFQIPIGLAFFMHSSVTGGIVALYPSPAGATESELTLETWGRLRELNPVLESLEQDAEGLIVNRLADPPAHAIAPIDRCYMLVGLVKANWEGISGGASVAGAVEGFFDELRAEGVPA